MKLYNITMRLNRLEMLNQMLRLHIIGTGSKVENELQDHLIKGSIDEYKHQASILGLNVSQTGIERRARFIVSQDYHNAHFSDRVWRDTRELSRRIERNLESVVIQGKNPREFAKKLRDLVSKDIKNITNATERLAYTESGRVWIQTQIEAYKDGGYEYLEIMTEPTACRHCSPHNGDIVKISEAVEGDNIPLWHPRCRCTTVAYFDDKNTDKSYNLEDMGYNKSKASKEVWAAKKAQKTANELYNLGSNKLNLDIYLKDEKLRKAIRNDYNLRINQGRQDKHIQGTNNYNQELAQGRYKSYLLGGVDPQELVDKYAGTGELRRVENIGEWINKEFVEADKDIGYWVNIKTGDEIITNRFSISYSKEKGVHIVPAKPKQYRR